MASAVASNGPAMASLVKKLPASSDAPKACFALDPASLAAVRRLFNTKGSEVSCYEADDDTNVDLTVPSFFSQDVLDRFVAPTAAPAGRGWSVVKDDDEALYLKVAMPGLGKEHVKVSAEKNYLVIKGEGEKEPAWDGDKAGAAAVTKYSRRIELTADAFKMDKIKAEMKNGVLRVTVPKVKEEERKDVFQVTIE